MSILYWIPFGNCAPAGNRTWVNAVFEASIFDIQSIAKSISPDLTLSAKINTKRLNDTK